MCVKKQPGHDFLTSIQLSLPPSMSSYRFCCGGDPFINLIVDGIVEEDLSSGGEMRFGSEIEFQFGDCENYAPAPTQSPTEFFCDDTTIEYEWNFRTDAWGCVYCFEKIERHTFPFCCLWPHPPRF